MSDASGHHAKKIPVIEGLKTRQVAVKILSAVVDQQMSLDGLTDGQGGNGEFLRLESRDRALVRAIVKVALRNRIGFEDLIASQLSRPLPKNAAAVQHILHVALAQILVLDVPDSAAVNLAVASARDSSKTQKFAKLINAVLRNVTRMDKADVFGELSSCDMLPEWLDAALIDQYGLEITQAMMQALKIDASLDLTVKDNPTHWAEILGGTVLPTGTVRLPSGSHDVTQMAGFEDGAWYVQDVAAALPARLMGDIKGKAVADFCAAPGGKTAQLLLAGGHVTAFEMNPQRLKRLKGNLERLQLDAELILGDFRKTAKNKQFDAVLLDAPCSSTGTIRRHPDIAWTKDLKSVNQLAELQKALLLAALDRVKSGGKLVFSNCSLLRQEGEDMIAQVLVTRKDITLDSIGSDEVFGLEDAITSEGMVRTYPSMKAFDDAGIDGFFACRFLKH